MGKLKIKKSIKRRFKITKSGKVLHRMGFGRHLKRKKSTAQKRRSRKYCQVEGRMAKKIKKALGK